ncbi:MAG: prephenate dehydrogenase/arogenate dehydrogenase family protein [Nitrospirae bacterium]|nr:prephenate dehydrogenase/arogenate dehydrogenase family protein [Nitrospirota bacterium]
MIFNKTAILGVGLLGASFSLALKRNGLCGEICGFGRSTANLEQAKEMGIIDSFASDPAAACSNADLVLLAAPVGSFAELAKRASSSLKKGAVVTDVGSVKGRLVRELEGIMPPGVHFVGSHPIAGSDRSGIQHADKDLFRDALCMLTPTEHSDAAAVSTVADLWQRLGAKVVHMDPDQHDRVYAAVSHLPHIIAYAMVNTVSDVDRSFLSYCGQGFRDMTRIAASSPEIWTDIALLNGGNIREMIAIFTQNLDAMDAHLKAQDADALKKHFARASESRKSIGQD